MRNNMSLSEKLTYSTVLIRCEYENGTSGSGTGFIMHLCKNEKNNSSIPVIVTNKHVVKDSKLTSFDFCKADDTGEPIDLESVNIKYNANSWIPHPDSNIDLCCLPIAEILRRLDKYKQNIFYIPLDTSLIPSIDIINNMNAIEDIVMIGYPIGLNDGYNHKPIIRKGITATHPKNDYQGKKHILVDMACFPGSSGSPVFILNQGSYTTQNGINIGSRIFLLGVLFGGPQYSAQGILTFNNLPNIPYPIVNIPANLGIIIKANKILDFETVLKGGR
jgi:V8-like Glu-specific endopeptidase